MFAVCVCALSSPLSLSPECHAPFQLAVCRTLSGSSVSVAAKQTWQTFSLLINPKTGILVIDLYARKM